MCRSLRALAILVLCLFADASAAQMEAQIDALVARMTLEEKIGQLVQIGGAPAGAIPGLESQDLSKASPDERLLALVRAGRVGSLIGRRGVQRYNELQRAARDSRLGIPLLIGHDMIHSARTCYPIPLALSCAWDEDLWERIGAAMAPESLLQGCNWTFTPMVDVALDARWGRIAEGAGSDPLVTSLFAAAMVRGLQGEDMSDGYHIAACAKHFVAYGAAMGGRDYNAVEMSNATFHDVYLPPFRAAVEAGVATVMPAFNSFNGEPCSTSRYLLTDVLRGELGFDGLTISDYEAIIECSEEGHGIATMGADVAAKALDAGMDIEMVSSSYADTLAGSISNGLVKIETLDEAVRRVLRVKFRLGLFDHPEIDQAALEKKIDFKANLELSREAAQKSTVLLKNDGVLPLKKDAKIALVGNLVDDWAEMFGCWSSTGIRNTRNTKLSEGFKANGVETTYSMCYRLDGRLDEKELRRMAAEADVVVAALGEFRGESGENNAKAKIELNPVQLKVIDILASTKKPFVAVVFGGRPLAMPELAKKANAVVMAWSPGGAGGWGVADVLLGVVEPWGRLTTDFPNASGECPKFYHRTLTGRPHGTFRQGPRWSTRYRDIPANSVWPFGFGLAYTTFEYANESARVAGDKVVFTADIKNTGSRKGTELVQVYVHDVIAQIVRPRRELKGFTRVALEPGETKKVEIEVPVASLGYTLNGRYIVEPGEFEAWIAPDSDSGQKLSFEIVSQNSKSTARR